MSEMIKMVIVLSLICGISGVTLASLRDVTHTRIEEQVLTYVQSPAINQVLGSHDNNPIKDRRKFKISGSDEEIIVFPAIKDGHLASVAFETSAKGFGGNIGVMVGFTLEPEAFSGIGITTMKETPGVGTRVARHGFTSQFKGHSFEKVNLKSGGGDIDAVSGATISSTGTVNAIRKALNIFNSLKPEIGKAWS